MGGPTHPQGFLYLFLTLTLSLTLSAPFSVFLSHSLLASLFISASLRLFNSLFHTFGASVCLSFRQQFGFLYLAGEGQKKQACAPSARLTVLSLHDLSFQGSTSIVSNAINCLDREAATPPLFHLSLWLLALLFQQQGTTCAVKTFMFEARTQPSGQIRCDWGIRDFRLDAVGDVCTVDAELLVCGDESGAVHFLDPFSLNVKGKYVA